MRCFQFVEKMIVLFVGLAFFLSSYFETSIDRVQAAENQESLFIFFVQNLNYEGNKNLAKNSIYTDSVKDLREALEDHANYDMMRNCSDTTNVKKSFAAFLVDIYKKYHDKRTNNDVKDPFNKSTTFLIVLNGHGAQYAPSKDGKPVYVFKNIGGTSCSYQPLDSFLEAYKEKVRPAGRLSESQRARFVFWVLTCRKDLGGSSDEPPTGVESCEYSDAQNYTRSFLYACDEDRSVDVSDNELGYIPILKALAEGVSGGADAERDYDGDVSFQEIHAYAENRNAEIMDLVKDKGIKLEPSEVYSEGEKLTTVLSSINREFYAPRCDDKSKKYYLYEYYRSDRSDEFFEGRAKNEACSVAEYSKVKFPRKLPSRYRYDERFKDFNFGDGKYWGAYFRGLDLSGATFSAGKLKGARFDHCDLSDARCDGRLMNDSETQKKEGFTVLR